MNANLPIPANRYYRDYVQLENGIGLLRLFTNKLKKSIRIKPREIAKNTIITFITGTGAVNYLKRDLKKYLSNIKNLSWEIIGVVNHLLGEQITVAGLLSGEDIIKTIKEYSKYNDHSDAEIWLTDNCINDENKLLDDLTPEDISNQLGRPVYTIEDFTEAINELNMIKS